MFERVKPRAWAVSPGAVDRGVPATWRARSEPGSPVHSGGAFSCALQSHSLAGQKNGILLTNQRRYTNDVRPWVP